MSQAKMRRASSTARLDFSRVKPPAGIELGRVKPPDGLEHSRVKPPAGLEDSRVKPPTVFGRLNGPTAAASPYHFFLREVTPQSSG